MSHIFKQFGRDSPSKGVSFAGSLVALAIIPLGTSSGSFPVQELAPGWSVVRKVNHCKCHQAWNRHQHSHIGMPKNMKMWSITVLVVPSNKSNQGGCRKRRKFLILVTFLATFPLVQAHPWKCSFQQFGNILPAREQRLHINSWKDEITLPLAYHTKTYPFLAFPHARTQD